MKEKKILQVYFLIVLGYCSTIFAEVGPTRLAIIDISEKKSVPTTLMDFLLVELSNDPNFILLEREKIAQILSEQKINLSLNDNLTSSDIIKTGQILAADAILMLHNEIKEENNNLRLRLIDARNGMKLLDSNLAIKTNSPELINKARLIAQCTTQHIQRMNVNPNEILLVGVSTFKSEELAGRWDWLSDVIPTNIEQNLALYSGIRLMERTEVKPLLDERELSGQLPESISASAILLTGSYKIDRENKSISISVKAKKNNQIIFETNTEGPLDEIEQACDELIQIIIKEISSVTLTKVMNPVIEAEMLAEEAKMYLDRKEFERALKPAESTHALIPKSPEYMELIIRSMMEGELSPQKMLGEDQLSLISLRLRVINLAENIIRICPLPKDEKLKKDVPQDIYYLQMHSYAMEKGYTAIFFATPKLRKDNRFKNIFSELDQRAWPFFNLCNERYANQSKRLYKYWLHHASTFIRLINNIDATIEMTKSIIESQIKSADKFDSPTDFIIINEFYYTLKSKFQDDKESLNKGEYFLLSLCKSPNSYLSLQAFDYILKFYSEISPSYKKLRYASKEYADFCKTTDYPNPEPIANKLYYSDKNASDKYESELLEGIIDFSIRNKLVKSNVPYWTNGTLRLADLLEKQGRYIDALNYLNKISDLSKKNSRWQNIRIRIGEIQAKHPETESHETLTASNKFNFAPELILSVSNKELIENITFRQLAIDDKEIVIAFSVNTIFSENRNSYGIIQLDRNSGKLISVQSSKTERKYELPNAGGYAESNEGPSMIINNKNVYLGLTEEGFLIFDKNGSTKRLNENNGLAYNKIRHLELLGDKIYALVGVPRKESGIMEFDTKTEASKIITSTRMDTHICELDNTEIKGLAADPKRNVLWVLSCNLSSEREQFRRLYCYNPEEGTFKRIISEGLEEFLQDVSNDDNIDGLQILGDFLIIYNGRGLCQFNLKYSNTELLIYNYRKAKWDLPWYFYPDSSFIPVKDGLVCVSSGQLLYYQDNKKEAENISKNLLKEPNTDKLEIRDIISTEDGFYVLTPDNLYYFN